MRYYNFSSSVALSYDPSSPLALLHANTGNGTQSLTPDVFDNIAMQIAGEQYEKELKVSILERHMDDTSDLHNLEIHDGPTLILVKTAEWPTATSTSSGATATGSYVDDGSDSDDDEPKLRAIKGGVLAGIVLGVIAIVLLSVYCCCWKAGCCGCRTKRAERMSPEERANVVELGNELMEQKPVVVTERVETSEDRRETNDPARLEEARIVPTKPELAADELPPRYTP